MSRTPRIAVGAWLVAAFCVMAFCTMATPVLAQGQPDRVLEAYSFIPSLRQSIQFRLQNGLLVADGPQTGSSLQQRSNSSGRSETRNITYAYDGPVVSYEYSSPAGKLTFTTRRHNDFLVDRQPGEQGAVGAMRFSQSSEAGVELSIGSDDKRRTIRGATIWQVWLAEPDLCAAALGPLFQQFDASWRLDEQARQIEEVLLRTAAASAKNPSERLSQLVEDLGSDSFAVRTAADRELRKEGREAVDYLLTLRPNGLDAEQQQRIRRIIAALSPEKQNDSPERVASRLMDDPVIWLSLLRREDVNIRRIANGQLGRLLDASTFPVEGTPEERAAAWRELSAFVHEKVDAKRN